MTTMLRRIILLLVLTLTTIGLHAQTDRQYVRKGNKYFMRGDFERADIEYRKALSLNENNTQALYNRGCANMQEHPDSAIQFFVSAGRMEPNKIRKAMSYHNIGWIYQVSQKYDEAIEAYKEALRNNPNDDETRYNLQLAKWQKKKQEQNGGGGQNQNQDKQDQNKDNQDQNKNNQDQSKDNQDQSKDNQDQNKDNQDQNKDNQDQNKDNQGQKDQDSKGQPVQQQQISDDNAERLLDAATQQEKRTQDRINKALQQPRRRNLQKNW